MLPSKAEKDVNSKYTLSSRSHLTMKLLPQLVQATESKVSDYIEKADNIALTLDIWTNRHMHSFLVITGHSFVNCVSQSFLGVFETFRGVHSGQNTADAVDRCLTKYDVHEKVQYFVRKGAYTAKQIKMEWPLLLTTDGLLRHFEILMGFNITDRFATQFSITGPKLLELSGKLGSEGIKQALELEAQSAALKNETSKTFFLLLRHFFDEKQLLLLTNLVR